MKQARSHPLCVHSNSFQRTHEN